MVSVQSILAEIGPSRSGRIVRHLTEKIGISDQTARQRVARSKPPVLRYPISLLPKREAFYYLYEQRNTEWFWQNLHRDLRETHSIYAAAIDGFNARGGVVSVDEFQVISGAPVALKKQVSSNVIAETLIKMGVMETKESPQIGQCYVANPYAIKHPVSIGDARVRRIAEEILLDGLREWVRKNGLASFNQIAIRKDDHPRLVGQFKWDLTGPSYLMPLRGSKSGNGFFVADVFVDERLDAYDIQYFIRKSQLYRSMIKGGDILPLLLADSFTGEAMTTGHKAGVILSTPDTLFGRNVGNAMRSLLAALKNAAAVAASNPEKLVSLLDSLSEIEGASNNMRGILFELIAGYIIKKAGASIDIGKIVVHDQTGESAEIDVLGVSGNHSIQTVECKGRAPGGVVELEEVEKWLSKLPVIQNYITRTEHLRERSVQHEIWTTGTFSKDALAKLQVEKAKRTKRPIFWKDGSAVRELVVELKLKPIREALDQHFFRHALSS